jgi:peptide/nickel transport system permease protein
MTQSTSSALTLRQPVTGLGRVWGGLSSPFGAAGQSVVWRKFRRNPVHLAAAWILLVLFVVAVAAPLIAPYDPLIGNVGNRLKAPFITTGHLLGTDEQGRDILTRIMFGARLSLMIGLVPVGLACLIGGFVGIVAGYVGGRVNSVLMRTVDVLYAFPAVLLAIAIAASLGAGIQNQILAITIVFIAPMARITESAASQVRVQEFIEAAEAGGTGFVQMFRYHLLPNLWPPVFVYASSAVGVAIILGSGLSFLGVGPTPPTPEWGLMLSTLRSGMFQSPFTAIMPGVFIFLTALSFNLVSDGLRDAMDVKIA